MTRPLSSLCAPLVGAFTLVLACGGAPSDAPKPAPAAAPEPTEEPAAKAEAAASPAPASPLVAFEDESGKYGYRNAGGDVVIAPTFAMASDFTEGVAAVVADGGWVFIDRGGETLARAFVFDNGADEFVDGRARIVGEAAAGGATTYGFIASSGEIAAPAIWSWALPYAEGLAPVCEGCVREDDGEHWTMRGGKWGYIDRAGAVVVAPRFDEAAPFAGGRASVKEGGRSFEIGPDGAEV